MSEPTPQPQHNDSASQPDLRDYWRQNIRLVSILLVIWAAVSYGAAILFVVPLNAFYIGGFPVGFWFAQQGSIITFVILIAVYVRLTKRLDEKFGVQE